MADKKPDFVDTSEILTVPIALAKGVSFVGLTAAQMRLAITLVSLAVSSGRGNYNLDKPRLQALTAVRLDNANRLLAPIADARVDCPPEPVEHVMWHDDIVGSRWFESIEYEPGEHRKSAGIITASLSATGSSVMYRHGLGAIKIAADELRRYSSVFSIMLRLHIGGLLEDTAQSPKLRITPGTLHDIFGSYAAAAEVRSTTKSGLTTYTSMSRAMEKMLSTARDEINALCSDFLIDFVELRDGPRIAAIDVKARRLTRK